MALRLVAFALLRIAFGSIIFDDMDKRVIIPGLGLTVDSLNMEEEGLQHCRGEAHAGSFHHDGARSNGNASFEFKFEVSQGGCYSVEEYHPGTADNSKCSQLLTTNAQLDIDWCKGKKSTITFDQSKDGGLWNFVGVFPFYVGHPGALKMSKPAGFGGKHLIVDAFRITRVADKCTAPLQLQLWRESEARKQETRGTPKATSALDLALRWQEGSLQLSVQSTPGSVDVKTGSVDVDLLASLKAQTSTLADTLKSHLQARSVVVKEILPLDARRLGGCRRLEAVGNSVDFLVRFKAEVAASKAVSEAALASELSTALAAVGAKFTVESTELHWQPIDATEADSDTASPPLPLILAGIASMLVVAGIVAGWRASRRVAPTDDKDAKTRPNEKELEEQNEKVQDDDEAADKNKGEMDDTASTATPNSDHTHREIDDIEAMSIGPMDTE